MPEAFYRCSFDVIKRSNKDSVVKKAAYNAREKIRRNETQTEINYSSKQDLLAQAILAPKGAKEWVFDRYQHYNKVEEQDNRKNSQLGRTLDIGLLHQLTLEQNKQLLEQYLEKHFVSRGMVADYCIHDADPNGDRRNIHAHIILSMRRLDGDGFSQHKERDWNNKKLLQDSRVAWAIEANMMFQSLGMDHHIDHRSLKDRGIDRLPQRHEGKQATNLKRREGVKVSKATYNDLVKELNQINQKTKTLVADLDIERIEKVQQFEKLFKRCESLMEKANQIQEAETAYWVRERQLEGEEVKVEERNIAKQYDLLWDKSMALAIKLDALTRQTLIPDDEPNDKPQAVVEQDNQSSPSKAVNDNREPQNYQEWLEQAEAKAVESRRQNELQMDGRSRDEPPNDEVQRSSRQRERLERTERSSTTGTLRSETIAEHTDAEEAISRAEAVERHYRHIDKRTIKNVVTVYRVKLVEIIAKFDPRVVKKDFADQTTTAYERDRLIAKYLRARGFSISEIHKAIRRASPAVFRKSKQVAYSYLKRLRDYTQQKERNLEKSAAANAARASQKQRANRTASDRDKAKAKKKKRAR